MKIAFLVDLWADCRNHLQIVEGLVTHPDVEAYFNEDITILGKQWAHATEKKELENLLPDVDFIIMNQKRQQPKMWTEYVEAKGLWSKVIIYDIDDAPYSINDNLDMLAKCRIYFKRSAVDPQTFQLVHPDVVPLNHSALCFYFADWQPYDAKVDVGCYFDPKYLAAVPTWTRRRMLFQTLSEYFKDKPQYLAVIGLKYVPLDMGPKERQTEFAMYHLPMEYGGDFDTTIRGLTYCGQIEYFRMLNSSKIIFTARPDEYNVDYRTWEALASPSPLCFLDLNVLPTPNYPEDGKHCFFYDAASERSIREAAEKAEYYLAHEKERAEIATAGREHTLMHHRPKNRMDWILERVVSDVAV